MQEVWKDIDLTDSRYEVSTLGRIRNKRTNHILTPEVNYKGYLRIKLSGTGVRKLVHVIVAETFIGHRPNEIYQVNHKDLNKQNNTVDNLEWVSPSENMKHGFDNQTESKKTQRREHMSKIGIQYGKNNSKTYSIKPVCQIDKHTGLVIGTFKSAREAAEITGASYRNISQVCRGDRKTHMGYKWKFLND